MSNFHLNQHSLVHVQWTYFNLEVRKYTELLLFGNDLCSSTTGYLYVKIINSNKDICFILSTRYKIIFVSLYAVTIVAFLLFVISIMVNINIIPRKPMGNGCSMIFLHHVGVISYQNGNKTGTKLKHVHIFWKEGKKQVHRTAEYYFFFFICRIW